MCVCVYFKVSSVAKPYGASKTFGKAGGTSLVNSSGGSQAKVVPIASLTPYQSKWVTPQNKFRMYFKTVQEVIMGSCLIYVWTLTTHKVRFLFYGFFSPLTPLSDKDGQKSNLP